MSDQRCVVMYLPIGVDLQAIMQSAGVKTRLQEMPAIGKKRKPDVAEQKLKKRENVDTDTYEKYVMTSSYDVRSALVESSEHKAFFRFSAHEYPSATLPSVLSVSYSTEDGTKSFKIPVKDLNASAMVRNLVRRDQKLGTSCDISTGEGIDPFLTVVTVKSPDDAVHTLNSRLYKRRQIMFMGLIQEVCTYCVIVRDPKCIGDIKLTFESAMGKRHDTLKLLNENEL